MDYNQIEKAIPEEFWKEFETSLIDEAFQGKMNDAVEEFLNKIEKETNKIIIAKTLETIAKKYKIDPKEFAKVIG